MMGIAIYKKALILFVQSGESNRVKLEKEIAGIHQDVYNLEAEFINNAINNNSTSKGSWGYKTQHLQQFMVFKQLPK